jgi:archaetidylinositol phosphate synthase
MRSAGSDELVAAGGELVVALGDTAGRVRAPAERDAAVADVDVGVVVGGLGGFGDAVDERDRSREVVEHELALERVAADAPAFGDAHGRSIFARSRKPQPATEILCEYLFRPLAHVVVLAALPLRVAPPVVVLGSVAAGIAGAVELARGELVAAALLVQLKTLLDNADGQLARAAGKVTVLGRYLDSEADLLVNAALFAAIGYATERPVAAALGYLLLTTVVSTNFNLKRLYRIGRAERADAMPAATGLAAVLARVYRIVYAPQNIWLEWFAARRVRRLGIDCYPDRFTVAVATNLGMSTQLAVLGACIAAGRPGAALLVGPAGAFVLVLLGGRLEIVNRRRRLVCTTTP